MSAEHRSWMEEFVATLQDEICEQLSSFEDPAMKFREDSWKRQGGGGGRTRILEEGRVFEKAGVNTSVVHGQLDAAFASKLPGDGSEFFAAGISLVLHPRSPRVPTVHANYRYIEHGSKSWFGGGADLTPYYLMDEDAAHFHRVHRDACLPHGKDLYPRLKATCDTYFYLEHRGERRGVGGIFFEDLPLPLAAQRDLVSDLGRAFLPAYLPILRRRFIEPFMPEHRAWQEIRRGRYVEFNLLYDRGTTFGLQTRGRTESILMSLPPRVRWVYDFQPLPDSEEARLLDVLRQPREWA